MVVAWVLTIAAFFAGFGVYAAQEIHDYPGMPPLTDHILPITLTAAAITIGVIVVGSAGPPRTRVTRRCHRRHGRADDLRDAI